MYNILYIREKIENSTLLQCEGSIVTIRSRTFKQFREYLLMKDMILCTSISKCVFTMFFQPKKSACIYLPAYQGRYLEI